MTALRASAIALSLAVSLGVPALVHSQTATDPEVRRAISAYPGNPAIALASLQRISLARLSAHDRSVAELYRGFSLIRLKRNADAEMALQRAVAFDPTATPEASHGSELLDAYRIARARVPVIASFDVSPREFIPQLDSITRLTYRIEGGRLLRRNNAAMRFLIVPKGTSDTTVVWRGSEAETFFAWNGKLGDAIIPAGTYDYILEALQGELNVPVLARRAVTITHGKAGNINLLSLPVAPRVLPESTTYAVEDAEVKAAVVRRGLIVGLAGALVAAGSAALVNSVINNSAPNTAPRYAVAGTYLVGLGGVLTGAYITLHGRLSHPRNMVTFPNTENVRLNRDLRAQYQSELERINRYNDTLRNAIVVKQVFMEGSK